MSFDGSWGTPSTGQIRRRLLTLAPLSRPAFVLVLIFFGIDAFFIGLHALLSALKYFQVLEARTFPYLKVSAEGGVPELFNYLKLCFVSLVLIMTFRRSRVPIYLILAGIFAYAFLDDAFTFHERLSVELVEALKLPEMWQQRAFAQTLYFAIVAILLGPLLVGGWLNASTIDRHLSAIMIAALLALGFFVVVVDAVHSVISKYSLIADKVGALVEDGGEMLAVTVCCWVALSIHSRVTSGS